MKQIVLLLLLYFPISLFAAQQTIKAPQLVFQTFKNCYEKEKKREMDLIKCMEATFQKIPNPDGYRVHLNQDSFYTDRPNKITLEIYDKYGQMLRCEGEVFVEVKIDKCQLSQGKPLTSSEQLSIEPPKQ